jgi:hypothetical protein
VNYSDRRTLQMSHDCRAALAGQCRSIVKASVRR